MVHGVLPAQQFAPSMPHPTPPSEVGPTEPLWLLQAERKLKQAAKRIMKRIVSPPSKEKALASFIRASSPLDTGAIDGDNDGGRAQLDYISLRAQG
jgi:hypothetical protein